MRKRFSLRALTVLFGTAFAVMAGAGAAFAHVTVSSPGAVKGGYATITVKVPTESATASTVGLTLQLPADTPFQSVTIQPKAGWTYSVDKSGDTVSAITWAATGDGIKPGEFDTFNVSVGPLPKDKDSVTFKAIQTYSDGTTANWVEQASGRPNPNTPLPPWHCPTLRPARQAGRRPWRRSPTPPATTTLAEWTGSGSPALSSAQSAYSPALPLSRLCLPAGSAPPIANPRQHRGSST